MASYQTTWNVLTDECVARVENYDFSEADADVQAVFESGASLYLGLEVSFSGLNYTETPARWAKVASHLFEHYWGNFVRSGVLPTTSAVEIGNEPDNDEFWHPPLPGEEGAASFYNLYRERPGCCRN